MEGGSGLPPGTSVFANKGLNPVTIDAECFNLSPFGELSMSILDANLSIA
jgi:hypothetical protein